VIIMLGVQDFIGYYDWTFEYLRRTHGEAAVHKYWLEAISLDSQRHARELILGQGFDGMQAYWAHTLEMEEAGYTFDRGSDYFRIDMFDCPSKGHLIQHGLEAYHDYCEHWWEMRRADDRQEAPPPIRGANDVRNREDWKQETHHLYLNSEQKEEE
jgi:hypothetical protein